LKIVTSVSEILKKEFEILKECRWGKRDYKKYAIKSSL